MAARLGTGPVAGFDLKGLDDFRREMRRADSQFPKQMGWANLRVGTEVVAKAKELAEGQPGATGKLARGAALRASRKQRAAVVSVGGNRYPWAFGAEFGSKRFKQFQPWRGNQWTPEGADGAGYAVHPAIRNNIDALREIYGEMIARLYSGAFPFDFDDGTFTGARGRAARRDAFVGDAVRAGESGASRF